jgi:TolB protein
VSFRDGNGEIYIMEEDGSRQLRLTTNEADDLEPVWSPNGSRMAFVSHLYGAGEIFVMDDDGGNQHRLTTNGAEDHSPDW